jgi:DNA mismatch repair ATPase MutL
MKSKKILILALLISSTVALLGCSNSNSKEISSKESSLTQNNTSDKDNNSPETPKNEENKANPDKTSASSDKKSTNTSKNTNSNSNNNAASSSSSNTNSDKNKQENATSLNYKSKLGFSITFPSDWKNRYKIKEDDNSMYVYFKSTDPNTPDNLGLLFFLKKNYTQEDENFSDSVLPNGKRHITVGNTTYLVGGPTDVNLDENNKDFQIFISIKKECEQAINTITP